MQTFKEFHRFIKHILTSRRLLITLILNNFRQQYLGSYLGLLWAFIQPIVFITVIWFVFEVGFKQGPTPSGAPFFLWLITGMVPWLFISSAITNATESIVSNSFLVKKVAFRVSIIPLVSIGSEVIIHLVLTFLLIVAFLFYGYYPTVYWIQLPFFIFCSIILLLGLSWLTSAIRVFVRDIGQFIGVLMQIGFWATPIFWSIDLIPNHYQWIIKLNPAYYIVTGYRSTFIEQIWFWEYHNLTVYYFFLLIFLLVLGAMTFKRLRPHFGDVL